jgi:hypothetical protein
MSTLRQADRHRVTSGKADRRSRAVATLMTIGLLASACGTSGPGATPVRSIGAFDQATVDKFVAGGWSQPQAITLALVKVSLVSADDRSTHFIETFPTGEKADITMTMTPGGTGDPNAVQVTTADMADGFSFSLAFHVASIAQASVPRRAPAAAPANVSLARFTSTHDPAGVALTADDGGADVVISALVQKVGEEALDAYIKVLEYLADSGEALSTFTQALKSLGSVEDALDLKNKTAKQIDRITAAGECAKNPTNPLTIKAYEQDPGLKDRLLEQARDTRRSVKANAAAQIIAALGSDFTDLLAGKAPWVGPVLGALSAYATHNFDADNEARMSALEKSIVKCEPQPSPSDAASCSGGQSGGGQTGGGTLGGVCVGAPQAFVGTVTFQPPGSTVTWKTTGVRWELAQSRGYPETGYTYDYVAVSGTISSHDIGVGDCTVTVDATGSIPADLNGAPLLRIDTTHPGATTYFGYSEMYVHIKTVTTPGNAPEKDCTYTSTDTSSLAWFPMIVAQKPMQVAIAGGAWVLAGTSGGYTWELTGSK